MTRRALCALLAALCCLPVAAAAGAPRVRANFTDVESELMCTTCRQPLVASNSPEAQREKAFIVAQIAKGYTKQEIEQQLVAQLGPAVLARPPASGFNLILYVAPLLVVVGGIGLLAALLPRWRRRTRVAAAAPGAGETPVLSRDEAARVERELAAFDG